jgi:hypothetical protein
VPVIKKYFNIPELKHLCGAQVNVRYLDILLRFGAIPSEKLYTFVMGLVFFKTHSRSCPQQVRCSL